MWCFCLILLLNPSVSASVRPEVTPRALQRRDADYGTEVITATFYGTASTFTRTALATVSTNYAGDAEIKLADTMVSAVNDLVIDAGACAGTKTLRWRTILPHLKKRNPPTRTTQLAPNDCVTRRVNSMIDQMRPGGRFNGLIALVRTGAVINRGLDGGLAGALETFYLRARDITDLDWVPQETLRNAVDLAIEIAYQVLDDPQSIADFFYSHALFGEDGAQSSRCDTEEKAPLCIDLTCWGDNANKCTLDPLVGCGCLNVIDLKADGFDDTTWFDTQQNFLNDLGFPEGPPSSGPGPACNGEQSLHWTTQEAASDSITQFCNNAGHLTGVPGAVTWQRYNQGTANDVILTIASPKDAQSAYTMSLADCINDFRIIINNCDGSNPNDADDLKHGGAFPHESGAILTIDPQVGDPESVCYGEGTSKWVDSDALATSQQQFCSSNNLRKRSGAGGLTLNLGTYINEVTLSVEYPENANVGTDECNKMFDLISTGCDPSDPQKNPLNLKHGGEVHVGGTVYTIAPTVDRTNPPLLTYGWNWQEEPEIVTNGTTGVNGAAIDKGDMQVCLDKLRTSGWWGINHQNLVCGNLHWDLGGYNTWKSANGCHMACVNSLSRAINAGANFAICDMKHQSAHCWEAFYNTNSDGKSSR